MKKIFNFFIISLAFFIVSANAQETTPKEYTIKKGDTLWDISDSILKDPFLWPNLWRVNPQVKNPDLIYPGDKIRIPSKEELMRMFPIPEEKIPVVVEPKPPEIEPVVEVPEKAPARYIVDKNLYIASGWISGEFPGIGEITDAPTGRTIFGKDDIVYSKTHKKAGHRKKFLVYLTVSRKVKTGDRFFTIRDVKVVKHPKTGKRLGHQIRVTGVLEIIGMDNNVPKAHVVSAFEELQTGDGILPYKDIDPPIVPDIIRTPEIQGYIVESYMNSLMTTTGDIVYLDKGKDNGLKTGDIFSVFSETPVEKSIGTIQIISLQPTTSAAIILTSNQEITIGDMWGNR